MRFRIVGDNVNFKVGVCRERKDKMGHMEHWFGSAAIIQHTNFHNLAMQSPQKPLLQMPPSTFLPSEEDVTAIKLDCVVLVLEVLVEHKYAEVVDVLDSYEQLIDDIYTEAGLQVDDSTKVHIGGD
uniref:Uncharacterized protein n=1 Tax=Magallana gigas TaxID=29159 RepID=A0A8W8JJY1_MAGGI